MKIRYRGRGVGVVVREVGGLRWAPENGYVAEVADAGMAAVLLTSPSDEFVVDPGEPLAALDGIGLERAAELTLAGIGSLEDLAALTEVEIEQLADETSFFEVQIKAWVNEARAKLGGAP